MFDIVAANNLWCKTLCNLVDNFSKFRKIKSETGEDLNISKRVVMSGENLLDAQPNFSNQSNQPTVSFTLDRIGAQKFGRATTDNVGDAFDDLFGE